MVNFCQLRLFLCSITVMNMQAGWSEFNAKNRQAVWQLITRGKVVQPEEPTVASARITFNDVIGGVPDEIVDLMAILQDDAHYRAVGIESPKGILFVGPPGTGKTLLASALAGELNYTFISISVSELVSKYVGESAANVRNLFERARRTIKNKQSEKVIIFIDEIDAIGKRRSDDEHNPAVQDETNRTINELLRQLDGLFTDPQDVQANKNIIVIGATNFEELIDPALKRPGRLGRVVRISLPDLAKRKAIIEFYITKKQRKIDARVSTEYLAQRTNYNNCADLCDLVERAAMNAARGKRTVITTEDFDKALASLDSAR